VGEQREATEPAAAAAAGMCQQRASRRAPFTVKSCVSQRFSTILAVAQGFQSDAIPAGCQLATSRLSSFLFLSDGSGSIRMRRPFSSLLFKRRNATATSAISAISTNPNPRQSHLAIGLALKATLLFIFPLLST
jgi:hypothetical protein